MSHASKTSSLSFGAASLVLAPLFVVFAGHFMKGAFGTPDSITLAAVMALLAAVAAVWWRDAGILLASPILAPVSVAFALVLTVALYQVAAPGFDREYGLMAALRLWAMGGTFVLAALIGFDERRFGLFRWGLAAATLLFAVVALALYVLSMSGALPIERYFLDQTRLNYPLLSPNSTALALLLGGAPVLAIGLAEIPAKRAEGEAPRKASPLLWIALAGGAVSVFDLLLTRSRTGILLAVAVGGAAFLIQRIRTRKGALTVGLPAVLVGLALLVVATFSRLGKTHDDLTERLRIFGAHLPMALDRPLAGHGFGGFAEMNRAVTTLDNFSAVFNVGALHNVYLQWMEQAGWIATAAMAICILAVIMPMLGEMRRGRRASSYWLRAALAAAVIAFGQGLLDLGLEHYSNVLLLTLVLGVGFGLCLRRRRLRRRKSEADMVETEAEPLVA
jgi:O-antigen ligase